MFPKKGERGYLRGKKIKYLLIGLVLVLGIFAFVITGYVVSGDTANLLTVMGILMVLPFANILTVYIAMFPYSSPDEQEYEKVKAAAGDGLFVTELAVTCNTLKTIYLPYVYIEDGMVLAYSPTKDIEPKKYEDYISGILASNAVQMHVKIFTQMTPFLKRVSSMEHTPRSEADEKHLGAEGVMKSISL